jgi:hypothetical protein
MNTLLLYSIICHCQPILTKKKKKKKNQMPIITITLTIQNSNRIKVWFIVLLYYLH